VKKEKYLEKEKYLVKKEKKIFSRNIISLAILSRKTIFFKGVTKHNFFL